MVRTAHGKGCSTRTRCRSLVVMVAVLMANIGCDRPSDQPPLAPVRGVVTLDGNPVVGKQVIFAPDTPDGARASIGTTDENGEYELMYTVKWEGAIIGPHNVTVSTPVPEFDGMPYDEDIPWKYTVDAETPLNYDVEDTDNVIDIELTSD